YEIAWKSKPSWYVLATQDHTVHPDLVGTELLLVEQIGNRRIVRGPYKILLFLREVYSEELGSARQHTSPAVRCLDMVE
ncbi:hypothetical protein AB9E26_36860, partial [Rhizobium leguminosarum]